MNKETLENILISLGCWWIIAMLGFASYYAYIVAHTYHWLNL